MWYLVKQLAIMVVVAAYVFAAVFSVQFGVDLVRSDWSHSNWLILIPLGMYGLCASTSAVTVGLLLKLAHTVALHQIDIEWERKRQGVRKAA